MPQRAGSIWVFAALSACLSMGYGVLFTIVGDYRAAYGITESEIGLIIGLGFLAAFVSQLVIAPVADRGRARQVVAFGAVVNIAGLLLMGFGTSVGPIVAGRLVSGVGIGAAVPAVKRIVILAKPNKLGESLGRLLAADVFGFAAGPAVSAILVPSFGLAAPFVVVAAATTAAVALSLRVRVTENPDAPQQRLAFDLLRKRPVAGGVTLGAASFLMIGGFDALWDVVHEDLGTPNVLANLGITLFAIPLIVLGPFGGRWAQRSGPYRVSAGGLLVSALFMVAYGQLPSGSWIFGVSMFHAIGNGLTISAAGVAVSLAVGEDRQAAAQGLLGGSQALAAGITAPVVGWTYQNYGRAEAYMVTSIGMLVLVGIGMALAYPSWRHQSKTLATRH